MELNNRYAVWLNIASLPANLWNKVMKVIEMWKKKELMAPKTSSVQDRPISGGRFKEWIKFVKTPEDRLATISKLVDRQITMQQFKELCEGFK